MKKLAVIMIAGLFACSTQAKGLYDGAIDLSYGPIGLADDSTRTSPLAPLLNSYYELKDALVKGDAGAAASSAADLLKAVNGVDMKALSASEHKAFMPLQDKLGFDARHISEVKNISHQREHFASLSLNMYALAKAAKLSDKAIYKDYCPMKKTYWLSSDEAIKNPYFGNEMPGCGQVKEILKRQ